MYSVKSREHLESVLTPKKLLFLVDAPLRHTAADVSTCIGTLVGSYPSASLNYMREIATTWARYRPDPDPDDEEGAPRQPLSVGRLRMRYATKIYNAMPKAAAPPAPLHHAKALVRLLAKVASMTAFNRTGDLQVWKMLLTMVPSDRAAELSTRDTPFRLAGDHFGADANRVVRNLFERNVEAVFAETPWETTMKANDFIFFVCILFECGEDLGTLLCCNHEVAYHESRRDIALFAWQDQLGCIAQNRLLLADPDFIYPIPSLILGYLELLAMSSLPGASAAEAMLCAIKTPEKVSGWFRPAPSRPAPAWPGLAWPLTSSRISHQMSVRESLYRLVNVDSGGEKN